MRRALVTLPESDLLALDALSGDQNVSRAELIRQAVSMYLAKFTPADSSHDADRAFGLWQHKGVDGLSYQARLRDEW